MASSDTYSDINIFVGEKSANELIYDEVSIQQSIMTILSTPIESRLFRPDFGSKLDRLLFEPLDEKTRFELQRTAKKALSKWEPRIQMERSEVVMDMENSAYHCTFTYRIPALSNKTYSMAFSLRARL
jgi:phage baseplate assembly protein W